MIIARQMQRAVHCQMCVVGVDGFALLARFTVDHLRAQHDVAFQAFGLRFVIHKCQHVGRILLGAKTGIEALAFRRIHHAQRKVSRLYQRSIQPSAKLIVRRNTAHATGALNSEVMPTTHAVLPVFTSRSNFS